MILQKVIRDPLTNSVEATWVDAAGTPVRCHTYSSRQMSELEFDLGEDLDDHQDLIAEVIASDPPLTVEDLERAKADKNAEINASRLAANTSTFIHSGKSFACDELSRSDIDGVTSFVALSGSLPPGWPGGWKAVDNTYLAISTVDEWRQFVASMVAAGNANFAHAQTLKAQLAAAATAEDVAAITW